ncbi:MAG TPA: SatD family protein [Mariniphaga sp.]|nr:SatD family protein [Mariniphaga sp.]
MKRLVLIGDIVSSKKIASRKELQKKLQSLFKSFNKSSKTIISPFTITLGDEFQAVFSKADNVFKYLWEILHAIYPVKVRFSFGIGEITTSINTVQAIGMDGPAFYNAREGLIELKQGSFLFNIIHDDKEKVQMIKQILFLLSHLSSGWKDKRYKILSLLYDDLSAYQIAEKLKMSDKAVYKNIDAGALLNVISITKLISNEINILLKGRD